MPRADYRLRGRVNVAQIAEALNAMPAPLRAEALPYLREHAPDVRWFTLHDGRVDAEEVE